MKVVVWLQRNTGGRVIMLKMSWPYIKGAVKWAIRSQASTSDKVRIGRRFRD